MKELETEILELPKFTFKNYYDVESAMKIINSIDLSMVKMKLMDEEEGEGWSEEFASRAEIRYRRFLCMLYIEPDFSFVPTGDIDSFWHQHILDTRAYAKDCDRIFGEFLHHFPYFGLRGDQDAKNLLDSFEVTKTFYFTLFSELYTGEFNLESSSKCHKGCSTSTCHTCARGCSGITCKTCKKG